MEENYINIFCSFVANLGEQGKITPKDAYFLLQEFEPVCEGMKTRQNLADFVEKYIPKYWELKILKQQLLDPNFIFKRE